MHNDMKYIVWILLKKKKSLNTEMDKKVEWMINMLMINFFFFFFTFLCFSKVPLFYKQVGEIAINVLLIYRWVFL